MSVFNRFSDIINSNINSILDQAEDPRKMVRLITQETQETLVEVRSVSAQNIADRKQLQARIRFSRRESRNWQDKAELAVVKGRDDLAKLALKEKARHDEAVTIMEADLVQIVDAVTKLQHDADRLEDQLRLARTRQKALILRGQTAKSRIKVKRQLHNVNCDEALSRFEEYERKLDDVEGVVESYDLGNRTLAQEINDLQDDEHLNKELQALKSRIKNTDPAETTA
ncbi:MAG: PspA/IM30 family protein [Proteobacteria bacterium]|nr:PspA/IM30 family protein [Pseudomonadota bacterium]